MLGHEVANELFNLIPPFFYICQKEVLRRPPAGEVAEGMATQFVSFREQLLQILGTKKFPFVTHLAHQTHGSVKCPACTIRPEDHSPYLQRRAREIIEGERNNRLSIMMQGFLPLKRRDSAISKHAYKMRNTHN